MVICTKARTRTGRSNLIFYTTEHVPINKHHSTYIYLLTQAHKRASKGLRTIKENTREREHQQHSVGRARCLFSGEAPAKERESASVMSAQSEKFFVNKTEGRGPGQRAPEALVIINTRMTADDNREAAWALAEI